MESNFSRFAVHRRGAIELLGGAVVAAATSGCSQPNSISQHSSLVHYDSITNVSKLIESGALSPVALTEQILARISEHDGRLKSYQTLMVEQALIAAKAAEADIAKGLYRGPLHGIPIGVKDLMFTKGVATKSGVAARSDFVPDYDATVVKNLKQAGAIILGKLNLTEGALNGYHPDFQIPVNPWNGAYSTSGSSSGSGVATAAGLCFASLGTDTGGSIRNPSSANGVVGLKPTYGRVSRHGVFVLAETLDHVGPMARYVSDAALMFEAMAGQDPNDPTSIDAPVPHISAALDGDIAGMRIGFDKRFSLDGTDPALATALLKALDIFRANGAEIVDVEMPSFGLDEFMMWVEICAFEALRAHRATYPSQAESYGKAFGDLLEIGTKISAKRYAQQNLKARAFAESFEGVLTDLDGFLCPPGHNPSLTSGDTGYGGLVLPPDDAAAASFRFAFPANFAGVPSLTLPCGFTDTGAPFGFQILGKQLNELEILRLGHAYEKAAALDKRHPDF